MPAKRTTPPLPDASPVVKKLSSRGCTSRSDVIRKNNLLMFDVPRDGNCGASSIVIAAGMYPDAFNQSATSVTPVTRMTKELWDLIKDVKSKTLDILQDDGIRGMLQAVIADYPLLNHRIAFHDHSLASVNESDIYISIPI